MKLFGHPIHPMLIAFPVAFYTAALVAYVIYPLVGGPFWFRLAFVANVAGVAMALVAALFGFGDWLFGIPYGIPAKSEGLKHILFNVAALALFAINLGIY